MYVSRLEADTSELRRVKCNDKATPLSNISQRIASRLTSEKLTSSRSGTFFHTSHTTLCPYLIVQFPWWNTECSSSLRVYVTMWFCISSQNVRFYHQNPSRWFSCGFEIPTDWGTAGKWGNASVVSRDVAVTTLLISRDLGRQENRGRCFLKGSVELLSGWLLFHWRTKC